MFKKPLAMFACVLPVVAILLISSAASAHAGPISRAGIVASVPGQDNGTMQGEKDSMEGEKGMTEGEMGTMTPGVPNTGALGQEQSGGMMEGEKMEGQQMESDQSMMGGTLPATGSADLTGWFLMAGFATFLLATGATLKLAQARQTWR